MPTVTVQGEQDDVRAMAGRWEGTYESEQNGREGTIQFELTAAGDTARGEILMRPVDQDPYQYQGSARAEQNDLRPLQAPTLLPIKFVRFRPEQVLGTLDPYIDPDCNCQVTTSFIGSVDGNEARGVFAIRGKKTWLAYGEWRAHRVDRPH
jgi:hypothetical protein